MDVDLSTDLAALLPLVAPLLSGHSDLAIGTRLARGSRVVRGPKREIISRCYNLLLRLSLATRFSDAQCGFKAIRADRARELLPLVEDTGWFFDTELLVLAERSGLRIHEVPVDWVDDPDTPRRHRLDRHGRPRAASPRLARGIATGRDPGHGAAAVRRARRRPAPGSAASSLRFAAVGVLSTLAYLALFLAAARGRWAPQWRQRDRPAADRGRQHRRQPAVHLRRRGAADRVPPPAAGPRRVRARARADVGVARALHAAAPAAPRWLEVGVLVAANVGATLAALPALPLVGVPAPAHRRRRPGPQARPKDRPMTTVDRPRVRAAARPDAGEPHRPPPAPAAPPASTPPRRVEPPAAAPGPALWRGHADDPRWVRPVAARAARRRPPCSTCGTSAPPAGRTLLLRRRAGGHAELEGVPLRLLRRGNSITVDKPPASLWVMEISARLFGVNSWSILVPAGARWASRRVGLLYLAGAPRGPAPPPGLLAGAVLALTPVAVLMFRFNNPDALLVLLLVGRGLRH